MPLTKKASFDVQIRKKFAALSVGQDRLLTNERNKNDYI